MLESRPILTKSLSAAVIYAAADITSQAIHLLISVVRVFSLIYGYIACWLVLAVTCSDCFQMFFAPIWYTTVI